MRWIFVVVALVACSSPGPGRGPSTPSGSEPGSAASPAAGVESAAQTLCRHVVDAPARCPQFSGTDMSRCLRSFEQVSADPAGRAFLRASGQCFATQTECEPLVACLNAAENRPTELRMCHELPKGGQRVGIPRPEWERRNGVGVTTFRDARSTKATPIETCGFTEAKEWLASLRCGDGSQPVRNGADAERVRADHVGQGGRCKSIIDHYIVPCPEARYDVFIDSYVCPVPDL